jgi:DNA-binding IclR family transcriptional regulator
MIDAPLDALDDAALSILRVIADAIGRSKGVSGASVSYEAICDATGVHRNTVAASLRTLRELGLIEVRHGGRRASNVYRLGRAPDRAGAAP